MTTARTQEKPDQTIGEQVDGASITARVESSLVSHRSTKAVRTKVETTTGVVTVCGTGNNAAEKTLVTRLVTDINGVTRVIIHRTMAVAAASNN